MVLLSRTPPTVSDSPVFALGYKGPIVVPKGCVETYKNATGWSNYADYIVEAT